MDERKKYKFSVVQNDNYHPMLSSTESMFGHRQTKKRYIYIILIVVAACILALGLGLGLGLKSEHNSNDGGTKFSNQNGDKNVSNSSAQHGDNDGGTTLPHQNGDKNVSKSPSQHGDNDGGTTLPHQNGDKNVSKSPSQHGDNDGGTTLPHQNGDKNVSKSPSQHGDNDGGTTLPHQNGDKNVSKSPSQHGDNMSTVSSTTTRLSSSTAATPGGGHWLEQDCSPGSLSCPWSTGRTPPLLLVSLDGFRADYLQRNFTPTIEKLRQCGVHTPYMRSVYPTLTFPNHYTIVTGLYPESHGIVDNNMYDAVINQTFSIGGSAKSNPDWWSGEPIWTTAGKQGKKTASYFWVGSEVNISGSQPDIWLPYNGKVSFEDRVDTVLKWLSWPEDKRPDFITLYFDEPDHTGHGSGPESQNVDRMLGRVDTVISRLMDGLYSRGIHNCVNLMIVADHGMESTSCDRKIRLSTYMNTKDYMVFDGTIGRIQKDYVMEKINGQNVVVRKSIVPSLEDVIKNLECKNDHFHAFTTVDMPLRHHYVNNERIGEVVLDVQAKWTVSRSKSKFCLKGNHGYDNIYKSMHALFLAHGPGFRQSFTADPFENIELYNMMSDLLKINPAPNNGTKGSLSYLLRYPSAVTPHSDKIPPTCGNTPETPTSYEELCGCNLKLTKFVSHGTRAANDDVSLTLGVPVTTSNDNVCQLVREHFISGYSSTYKAPIWTSYLLKSQKELKFTNYSCVFSDSQVQPQRNCSSYHNNDVTHAFMYDPGFNHDETTSDETRSRLSSNIVPMYKDFKSGVWKYLWTKVSDYVVHSKEVQVTVGPVYDHNKDGLWNPVINSTVFVNSDNAIALPTHFFIILARCRSTDTAIDRCERSELDVLSYILPHLIKVPNCLPFEDYVSQHIARIRDVEIVTGLRFLTAVNDSARLRTFLPVQIWPTKNFKTHWEELPCTSKNEQTSCPGKIPLLLISLDGFKAQYLQRKITPVIEKLRTCGVHTKYLRSVYPTVTFPNHYTMVTGLYPESHGIISNKMYDEEIGKYFTISSRIAKDPRWWKGEPIWITAKKQNKISATYFWPGSDVNISGTYPDYYKFYSGRAGFPERVATVLNWLTMTNETGKPDFLTLYFDQPDHAGHLAGPESDLVHDALMSVDAMIGRLMDGLYQKGLHDCVNIIIVADHGFNDVSCSQIIKLNNYLHEQVDDVLISSGTFGRIETKYHGPRKNVTKVNPPLPVTELLNKLMCNATAMKVFTKDTIPKRFHYSHNNRIGDILLDMRDEWLVTSGSYYPCKGGNHGWDNLYKSMHALFLAHGPVFKKKIEVEPFENIELYNLMSDIIGITPAKNNGTKGSLNHILNNPPSSPKSSVPIYSSCKTGTFNLTGCNCNNRTISLTDGISEELSPVEAGEDNDTCLLKYPNLLIGYNRLGSRPMFATTIPRRPKKTIGKETSRCIYEDPRAEDNSCDGFNSEKLTMSFLYYTDILVESGKQGIDILPTAVPMYPGFSTGIWNFITQLIEEYAEMYNVSITTGPIYDENGDGLADDIPSNLTTSSNVSIPSHYFVVMIKCTNPGMIYPCGGMRDVIIQSFVLPHVNDIPNCLDSTEYLKDNVARVRDIELLTGLSFFTQNVFSHAESARLRTFLPVDIWPAEITTPWIDLPCRQDADTCNSDYRPLILISLDGYRADYLLRNFTPYIGKLSRCGVHAPYMRSVYPTKTFPNHYSIVTGLYPESHGIIDNSMYDDSIKKKFALGKSSSYDPKWWKGEPIWLTAQKQNKTTATYFWPGSDVEIQGQRPDMWKKYDGSVLYDVRVKQVLNWMSLPEGKRPDFITLYFDEPDHSGHEFGPDDIAHIGMALERVDLAIGQLMEGLYHKGLHNCANIIIVADHGMSDISCDRLISFRDFLTSTYNMQIYDGAFSRIDNKHKYKSSISLNPVENPVSVPDIVKNLTCGSPHFKVFMKEDLPKRHHYANSPRIEDILVDVQDRWLVTYRSLKKYNNKFCAGGNHGYDNTYKSMNALFLASGPVFKKDFSIEAFENIELYNLMADVLQIDPAPNNGTYGRLSHILSRKFPRLPIIPSQNYSLLNISMEKYINICSSSCHIPAVILKQNRMNSNLENKHLPFGRPAILPENSQTEVYINSEVTHISAFDTDSLQMPSWVSYTLTSPQVSSIDTYPSCLVSDGSPPQCENTSINGSYVWVPLYRPGMGATMQSYLSMNFVPMLKTFKSGVWKWLHDRTTFYTTRYNQINVITGPIFDYDIDGHGDDPDVINRKFERLKKPSHFFYILSRSEDASFPPECESIKTLSFIIPHKENVTNCQTIENYLLDNVARIRDIELLTGYQFFTKYGFSNVTCSLRLRTELNSAWW